MRKAAIFVLLAALLAAAFLAGRTSVRQSAGGRKILYYTDPMHPSYQSSKPGIAPDCGMDLVPVYADGAPAQSPAATPGAVKISSEDQQRIGVRVGTVERASGTHAIRLAGRVAPDETRLYKLNIGVDGVIREISGVTTGSQVRKGQLLAKFSAPDARIPIQGFLVSLDVIDGQRRGGANAPAQIREADLSAQLAADRLLNLGMSRQQVETIRRTREVVTDIQITSPVDGFVLARNASLGQRCEKGAELFRIGDLDRVWILAAAFPQDAKYIRPGQTVSVKLPGEDRAFSARVSEVLPEFDASARALKVRLEADNPGHVLRPDMLVDVTVTAPLPPALVVPAEAVLDSGLQKTVFVERDSGVYEPRQVQTGWSFGGRVQILEGLEEGERIVTSGNFLLDSESRIQQAAAGRQAKELQDPVCGMALAAAGAQHSSEYKGERYFFCSDQCRRSFEKSPGQYLNKAAERNEASGRRAS